MTSNKTFCAAPFNSLYVGTYNHVKPCASFDGPGYDTSESDIMDIWQGPDMSELRRKMLGNETVTACHQCDQQQSCGQIPEREWHAHLWKNSQTENPALKKIVFKSNQQNNQLNRDSTVYDSLTLASEEKEFLINKFEHVPAQFRYDFGIKSNFSAMDESWMELSSTLQELKFESGDTLLSKDYLEVLKKVSKSENASNINLSYRINGTNIPTEEHLALWKKFKSIRLEVCVQGIESAYEYLHYPSTWSEFQNGINELRRILSNFKLESSLESKIIINNLNIYYLDLNFRKMNEIFEGKVKFGISPTAVWYSPWNLPEKILSTILEKIKAGLDPEIFNAVKSRLRHFDPEAWKTFLEWNPRRDLFMQKNLGDYLPEVYELLEDEFHLFEENKRKRLANKPEFFCPAPFRNLVQDYLGRCGPCPYVSGQYNLNDTPIPGRWDSTIVSKLREEYLAGKKPDFCKRCWDEEAGGMTSRRLVEIQNAPDTWEELVENEKYKNGPTTMVLRLSNLCTYACRTCHSLDSSKYHNEGIHYAEKYGDRTSPYFPTDPRREFSAGEILQEYELTKNLKRLEFYGGEPMINETHEVLLSKLIEEGRSKNIELYYNTNASSYPSEKRIDLWKNFKSITLAFSLDGIDEYFHYIRWPGDWEQTRERIERIRDELPTKLGIPLELHCNLTVSSLNIYNLDTITAGLTKLLNKKPGITIVHTPPWYNPQNLPPEIKKIITRKLTKDEYQRQFDSYVAFMNAAPDDENQFQQFILWTLKKDRFRGVRFEETFPEYWSLLRPYFNDGVLELERIENKLR